MSVWVLQLQRYQWLWIRDDSQPCCEARETGALTGSPGPKVGHENTAALEKERVEEECTSLPQKRREETDTAKTTNKQCVRERERERERASGQKTCNRAKSQPAESAM